MITVNELSKKMLQTPGHSPILYPQTPKVQLPLVQCTSLLFFPPFFANLKKAKLPTLLPLRPLCVPRPDPVFRTQSKLASLAEVYLPDKTRKDQCKGFSSFCALRKSSSSSSAMARSIARTCGEAGFSRWSRGFRACYSVVLEMRDSFAMADRLLFLEVFTIWMKSTPGPFLLRFSGEEVRRKVDSSLVLQRHTVTITSIIIFTNSHRPLLKSQNLLQLSHLSMILRMSHPLEPHEFSIRKQHLAAVLGRTTSR